MKIIGTGSAHPTCAVSNEMLEQFLETTDEWITERTGIKERCVISSEKLEDLAVEAANKALENAGLTAADIDFLICSNVVNEYVTPALSCIIQGKIGATCPTIDINAACAGFIYALDMAEDKLQCKKAKNILIVCAEEPTRMADWSDRRTCVLFGDGVGAAVLTEGDNIKGFRMSASSATDKLWQFRPLQPTPYISKKEEDVPLQMKGQDVFKFAVKASSTDISRLLEDNNLTADDIDHVLLHQANIRIINSIREYLRQPAEKFPVNIEDHGNSSSSCCPILLDECNRKGMFKRGDKIIMSAFGAGFVSGAVLFEW